MFKTFESHYHKSQLQVSFHGKTHFVFHGNIMCQVHLIIMHRTVQQRDRRIVCSLAIVYLLLSFPSRFKFEYSLHVFICVKSYCNIDLRALENMS